MIQLILYLLIGILVGIFNGLNGLVKWLAKGAGNSNLYLRNGLRTIMILTILFGIFYTLHFYQNRDIIFFDKLMKKPTIEDCQKFINDYPNSKKISEAESWIDKQYKHELQCANDSLSLSLFIGKYSNDSRFKEEYKRPYLYEAIRLLNCEKMRLENERNERIRSEQIAWNTEERAWQTVSEKGTLAMFRQYLKLYPNGVHKSQAHKKIIDLEVADVFRDGKYGKLPSMDKTVKKKGLYTAIVVTNDTQYALTLLYSGVESLRVVINPHGTRNIKLKSGSYRIVASVDANGVRNFAGSEDLTGGSYSVSYYISTSRY